MNIEDERLRFVVTKLGARFWETDENLIVTMVSCDAFDARGIYQRTTIGRTLLDIFGEADTGLDRTILAARLESREALRDFEYARQRSDGTIVRLRASAEPRFDDTGRFLGYRGVSVDVMREAAAQDRFASERQRRQEAIADGIATFDRDDRLVAFNQAYRDMYGEDVDFGVSFHEMVERATHRNLHVNRTPEFDDWTQQRLSRDYEQLEPVEQMLANGRWIRRTSARMADGGCVDVGVDITSIKERERALHESEERFRRIFASAATGIAVGELDGRYLQANPAFCRIVGMSEAEVLSSDFATITHPDDRALATERRRRLVAGDIDSFTIEKRYLRPDGTVTWVRNSVAAMRNVDGASARVVTICEDITARKEAEAQLAESEARFEQIFAAAATGIVVSDPDGSYVRANPAFCRMLAMTEEEVLASDVHALTHPADLMTAIAARNRLLDGEIDHLTFEKRNLSKDGRAVWVRNSSAMIRAGDGTPVNIVTISEDVSARKEAEARLRESRSLLQIAGETAKMGGWSVDLADRRVTWSDEACAIRDLEPGALSTQAESLGWVAPEHREHLARAFEACAKYGEPYDTEFRSVTAKGREIWIRSVGVPVRDETGEIVRIQGSVQDVTESREALDRARALAARLENTLESIGDAFFAFDRDWRFTYCNARHEQIVGRRREEMLGQTLWEVFPEHRDSEIGSRFREAMETSTSPEPFRSFSPASKKWLDLNVYASDDGLTVYARDVTDRLALEQQFAHAARLTSLGEMAASLAHEINQPLSVINLSAENAAMEIETDAPDLGFVEQRILSIVEQVGKLRDLINHMRTFSRKHDNDAGAFDPADAIRGAVSLVNHDFVREGIDLESSVGETCPAVRGIPIRLEQALVNLLTNARDAVCERAAREPGARQAVHLDCHVRDGKFRVAVSDTGGGMPDEVREKLFEPFFTTKEGGQGTGLGMPIVLSVVTGMGGTVEVENIGEGCRITLALPIVESEQRP